MEYEVAGIRFEAPKKPKFEKDFIMLSEFSELVGPVPVVSGHETSGWWWVLGGCFLLVWCCVLLHAVLRESLAFAHYHLLLLCQSFTPSPHK